MSSARQEKVSTTSKPFRSNAEFGEQDAQVGFDGVDGEEQFVGDLLVGGGEGEAVRCATLRPDRTVGAGDARATQ
ncbi:hypothetical protein NSK11_contig00210-0001 [Nocardia seriolae]|uniref:Uncharacterized protein n=1 Tax=Nocardia seriolae TaxID=37332 RepID=A0ABC9Z626_9NOCA|nr:hypothetical protein NSERKGN1266_64450 [Nocardia seriolae]BEK93681.1 hypothetical protein NSER024013_15870 [Nocardia seriolae]GAM51140.1 hypothetical protein NS07_v2contig00208-0001 [Nocardia seriolae]GAP33103.1 hypothetical protein NSK11_contig00210-0001 [Nocardia seriolae]GEM28714.1 hypothetical protein NS2_69530 [Nocardia seriolae NBRC 15557]